MEHKQSKAAILVWLYHTDLWPEISALLEPLKDRISVYLGLCSSHDNQLIIKDANQKFDNISFQYFDNSGADVRPFLHQLQLINPVKEPYFFKIHSKMSYWGFKSHVNWRSVLLHSILGSASIFDCVCSELEKDNVGMVCNQQLILNQRETTNAEKIKYLSNMLNLSEDKIKEKNFCGGNIFAGKTVLFQKYFNHSNFKNIEPLLLAEKGKVTDNKAGGSFCHALERVFGYIIENENSMILGSKVKHINISNAEAAENNCFRLIINYDESCYIAEDLNVYGRVLQKNKDHMLIRWTHLSTIVEQPYRRIGRDTYIKATS